LIDNGKSDLEMDDDWGTPISGNHRIEVTNFGVKPLGDSNWNRFRCFCFGQESMVFQPLFGRDFG